MWMQANECQISLLSKPYRFGDQSFKCFFLLCLEIGFELQLLPTLWLIDLVHSTSFAIDNDYEIELELIRE